MSLTICATVGCHNEAGRHGDQFVVFDSDSGRHVEVLNADDARDLYNQLREVMDDAI